MINSPVYCICDRIIFRENGIPVDISCSFSNINRKNFYTSSYSTHT